MGRGQKQYTKLSRRATRCGVRPKGHDSCHMNTYGYKEQTKQTHGVLQRVRNPHEGNSARKKNSDASIGSGQGRKLSDCVKNQAVIQYPWGPLPERMGSRAY